MRTCSPISGGPGNNPGSQTENRSGDHQCSHGKILVVGLGPGQRDLITPRALASLHQAEVIIGYKTYIALIKDLIADKQVISSGMRKETERARLAVDMAKQGNW